ncbi:MAG: MarR family transcriptional regulator [Melioribacteraceae bacterium]
MINTSQLHHQVEELAELVCELTHTCNRTQDFFAKSFNLTPAEFRVLKLFAFNETLSIKELCDILSITPGRITQIISGLEEKKFVIRISNTDDKRNVAIKILPKSRPFIENLYNSHMSIHEDILNKMEQPKRDNLIESLRYLITELNKKKKE